MAGRRPLGSALQLPAEKLAFIRDEPPESVKTRPLPNADIESETPVEESPVYDRQHAETRADKQDSGRAQTRRSRTGKENRRSDEPPSLLGELRVPLTTRLHPSTADALRRANLEQRLKRLRPATQQEIIEAAVHDWLWRNGYMPT